MVGSTFRDTNVGHHIKSRAQETIVRDSTIDDGQGDASYSIDLPNGGRALLENNTLTQTDLSDINTTMVAYGAEGNLHSHNSLLIKNNLFIDNHANGKGIYNHTDTAIILQGKTFQDVKTEVVGPHEFIDVGASDANPAGDGGAITAEDAANDDSANDGRTETADLIDTPYKGLLPRDRFSYTTKNGSSGKETTFPIRSFVLMMAATNRIGCRCRRLVVVRVLLTILALLVGIPTPGEGAPPVEDGITNVRLQSTSGILKPGAMISFGQAFARGDVPAGTSVTATAGGQGKGTAPAMTNC